MSALYNDLPLGPEDIRLLTVLRGDKNAPLECSLAVYPLGDFSRHSEGVYQWSTGGIYDSDWDPEASQQERVQWVPFYEALSYTWGDLANKVLLKVNQSEELVTTNLNSALLTLRFENQERPLWVDALCINQNDIEERNNQVQRMPSIYQRATRTLVWLGEADDSSDHAFHLLERLGGSDEQIAKFKTPPTWDFAGPQFDPLYGIADAEANYINTLDLIGVADLDDNDWVALESLFSRPYWKRIWIVQEITNAQDVEIRCGSNSLSWQTIDRIELNKKTVGDLTLPLQAVKRYTTLFGKGAIRRIMSQRKWTRHWIRSQGWEQNSTSFVNLLERFRDFNCTDPRDKVYALLGLASVDKNMPLPKPDYSKSVSEVYCTTARAIIQYTRDLNVLCLPKSYKGLREHHLPFWCPDWTTQPDEIYALRDKEFWPTFKTAGETLPQGPDFNFNENEIDENGKPMKKRLPPQTDQPFWVVVDGDGASKNAVQSTIRHPEIDVRPLHATNNHDTLILKGYAFDGLVELGRPCTAHALKTGEWKKTILEWEALVDKLLIVGYDGENRNSPEAKKAKLKTFILTLFRGVIYRKETGTAGEQLEVLYEFYLIWTDRLLPSDAKNPQSTDHFTRVMFEDVLLQYIGKWKMALGIQGRLMLVPADAERVDCVAVLFGCDVPLVLRPKHKVRATGQVGWQHIGTVYGMDLMRGEALYLAEMEKLEVTEFALF